MTETIIESGTPVELAERLKRLPAGEYRVLVQRVRSRRYALAAIDRIAQDVKDNPDPDLTGKSDDEVMDMVDAIVGDTRAREPANSPE